MRPLPADPSPLPSSSSTYHAIIGGIVAFIVFLLLILLIFLGHYLIRHKGQRQQRAGGQVGRPQGAGGQDFGDSVAPWSVRGRKEAASPAMTERHQPRSRARSLGDLPTRPAAAPTPLCLQGLLLEGRDQPELPPCPILSCTFLPSHLPVL